MAVNCCGRAAATLGRVIPFQASAARSLVTPKSTITSLAKSVATVACQRQSGSNYSLKRTAASGRGNLQLLAAAAA